MKFLIDLRADLLVHIGAARCAELDRQLDTLAQFP